MIGAYCASSVLFAPVTTTFVPVVRLRETKSDVVDHEIVLSTASLGITLAPIVTPGPPVRIRAPPPVEAPNRPRSAAAPVNAIRNTPRPAASYFSLAPAGSHPSADAFGAARNKFQGL